jgi:hypothetical protein
MITTTLNAIREQSPCADGWTKLLKHLGKTAADDEPLSFVTILDSNGLDDALWCTRAAPEHNKVWQLFELWCARQVQHLMTDPRSFAALDIAERHAHGLATDEELEAARAAAEVVANAAWSAASVARAPAWDAAWAATWAATLAARAAAKAAAKVAARAAAWDAASAAAWGSARAATWGSTWDAAAVAAEDAQAAEFRRIVMETAV